MTESAPATIGQAPARLTTDEFAAAVGLTACQVRKLIRAGKLTVVRIAGARQTIPASEVSRLIAEATIPAAAKPSTD